MLKTCTACPFRWVTKTLKFLGIWLTPDLGSVYEHNFPAILRDLKKDLQTWNSRYFSWFGRAAIIKMVVLPRFLYPLRNLPIKIPQACFKSLRSILLGFLWGGKKPRIKLSLLSRPREKGGIGLPNFHNYYLASHLTRVIDWHCHGSSKAWVGLESVPTGVPLRLSPCIPWNCQSDTVKKKNPDRQDIVAVRLGCDQN